MGFIPSLKTVSIALKLLSGCLMRFREGINPSPTLIGMLSIIFNCALIGLNPEPSYETTGEYNSEPQNVEGWFRCAQSFINFYKKDRIHSFDIRYSLFLKFLFRSNWPGRKPAAERTSSRDMLEIKRKGRPA